MKKVELLAPAGNYEALKGAIAAGANAVYLGGDAFGARAYADNFSQEEICMGIRFAHLHNKKIYLTVNTLVKEREFSQLYDFLLPFYEAGMDGIIIQDMGVFQFVKEHFPNLSLHVSTQMTITGAYGAQLIKDAGAERIVPARELSLSEIKRIKEKVDIEIETFIHGAMCYCYSGQCLLSSILGGRSGNRGRCAQPCRLPYHINGGKEHYPLSMKDMCTISILPQLIEAGIDSFKIEGRMKKPEYAAGVTAIYRKYIDKYYQDPKHYEVSDEDMEYLKALYIRSDIMEGYYHKHNGNDMLTISSPAYLGSDEELLTHIRNSYINKKILLPVQAHTKLKADAPAMLTLSCKGVKITTMGAVVQKALKQPLSREKVEEQLLKSGNTDFDIVSLKTDMHQDIFMPVSALNQLRRDAIKELSEKIMETNGCVYADRRAVPYEKSIKPAAELISSASKNPANVQATEVHVLVSDKRQLEAALTTGVQRIYLDRQIISETLIEKLQAYKVTQMQKTCEFYLAFPYIVRKKDEKNLEALYIFLQNPVIDGALVRNLETISFLEEKQNDKPVVADTNLYVFNRHAVSFMRRHSVEQYLPIELNQHEIKDITGNLPKEHASLSAVVYGHLPMMLSANCLKKTTGSCNQKAEYITLTDRYHKNFPVYADCTYCYNIIYNSVPLSLHRLFEQKKALPARIRLDFSIEDSEKTENVIQYFMGLVSGRYKEPGYQDFTTGHYKRGVE